MSDIQTVCVIGLGYIGLPTAATLANAGYQVVGVDVSPEIIETINNGDIHISELGLDILVRAAVQSGRLRASSEPVQAHAFIIAVPTPINPDKSPDLSYVIAAVHSVAKFIKPNDLVIVESTIPPRTCVDVVSPLLEELTGFSHEQDYYLAHCPERVIPGKILHEILHNDRIIGGATPEATVHTEALYAGFVRGKLLRTDATTAEMCKLMENTYRDVNIALANELAVIAEDIGVDIAAAIDFANHHPRVNIHKPGIGVGGHCIPVDPWFIAHAVPEKAKLIKAAREINDARPGQIVKRILEVARRHPTRRLALFGLSYKPDVDDLRESPAIEIARGVAEALHDDVYVVEPHIRALPPSLKSVTNLKLVRDEVAYDEAQVLVTLVEHSQFKQFKQAQEQLVGKILVNVHSSKLEPAQATVPL